MVLLVLLEPHESTLCLRAGFSLADGQGGAGVPGAQVVEVGAVQWRREAEN